MWGKWSVSPLLDGRDEDSERRITHRIIPRREPRWIVNEYRCPKCKSTQTETLGECKAYILLDCGSCLTVVTIRKHALTGDVPRELTVAA